MGDGGVTRIIDEVTEALEKTGGKISTAIGSRLHGLGQATKKAAQHFDDAEEDIAGKVPVYMVDHDGNVKKLVGNDLKDADEWAGKDTSGITKMMEDGKTTDPAGKYSLTDTARAHDMDPGPRDRNPLTSSRVDPHETELSLATARVRRAEGERKKLNYAAFHYKDDEGHEFILVGKSNSAINAHSEQVAGIPFLKNKMSKGVVGVYTERAPCVKGQRNCTEWLGRYFPQKNLQVTHTFDYDLDKGPRANKMMGRYISGLFR